MSRERAGKEFLKLLFSLSVFEVQMALGSFEFIVKILAFIDGEIERHWKVLRKIMTGVELCFQRNF